MISRVRQLRGPAILFCPADRPDRYGKALQRADSIIIDLEDAVDAEQKPAARQALAAWAQDEANKAELDADPVRVAVRVNAVGTEDFDKDMELVASIPVQAVMIPKAESADQAEQAAQALPGVSLIALCETPLGIVQSAQLAQHPAVHALMWGAEDLIAAIGGSSSRKPDGAYRDVARESRAQVLLSSAAFGKPAIDSIYADFSDASGLAEEARDASASGFALKACIHPAQSQVVREAFAPTDEEVEYARALLAEVSRSAGVVQFRGSMVDEPLIRHARNVLQRSDAQ